jgi:hypothetical protein
MLGQGKADYSRNQGDRPTSNGHRDCVECIYPLLVNLKQCPEMFYRRWLLGVRVRLVWPPAQPAGLPASPTKIPQVRLPDPPPQVSHFSGGLSFSGPPAR